MGKGLGIAESLKLTCGSPPPPRQTPIDNPGERRRSPRAYFLDFAQKWSVSFSGHILTHNGVVTWKKGERITSVGHMP